MGNFLLLMTQQLFTDTSPRRRLLPDEALLDEKGHHEEHVVFIMAPEPRTYKPEFQ